MTTNIDTICKNLSNVKLEDNTKIINNGTGAGGANTNKNGKLFEEKIKIIVIVLEHIAIKK
jgi:hypothetical protein